MRGRHAAGGDVFGRKRMFQPGLLLLVIPCALIGLSATGAGIIGGRFDPSRPRSIDDLGSFLVGLTLVPRCAARIGGRQVVGLSKRPRLVGVDGVRLGPAGGLCVGRLTRRRRCRPGR